jgi:WD40 repeat protein
MAEDLPLVSDCLAWSPDGETLAWGSWRSVSLWRPGLPRRIERLPGHRGSVRAVAWSPDGRTLASCDDTGSLLLWDVATTVERRGRPLSCSPPGASQEDVTTLTFSADGKTLVAGTSESRVLRWDLASGRIEQLFGESTGFAVHPSRPLVAIATEQNEIPLVDLESGKPLARPLQAPAPVVEVEFTPDGETLAAGLEDGRVALLELPEGKAGRILAGGDSSSLSFDGAGGLLATGDAAIWDLASGRPALPPLPGNLARAQLNPRRPLLASTVSGHGSLILWDLDARHWVRRACRIANRNLTREEWQFFVGEEVPYRKTCPELPPG